MTLDTQQKADLRRQWKEEGWVAIPGFFSSERTAQLRIISEYCLAQWRLCNPENGKPGENSAGSATSMRHLNHPGYYKQHPEWFAPMMDAVADPYYLEVVEAIIGEPPLFRSTSLFMNPIDKSHDGNWHRDTQFLIPNEADERRFIESGPPDTAVQLQVALVPSDDVEFVPKSHLRWDTDEEYTIRRADGGANNRRPLATAIRVAQKPGDMLAFNPFGMHRGRYHADRYRRTLMYTYTGKDHAMRDYFSNQPWFLEPGHLDGLCPETREFFQRFVDEFRGFWEASSAGKAS